MTAQRDSLTLDGVLKELEDTLHRHRHIFSAEAAATPAANDHVGRLALAVAARTGIGISASIRQKLHRILAPLPPATVEPWVVQLERSDASEGEWPAVIEMLTVHETFFFRDQSQIGLLRDHALPKAVAAAHARGDRTLRLWSAGCATGEEAYSLGILALEAMAAADAADRRGNDRLAPSPGWSLSVLGTDISRPVITRARQGLFLHGDGLSPFRDMPPNQFRWFDNVSAEIAELDGGTRAWRVGPELAGIARFDICNLMGETLPPGPFDVICCRNVLVYMEPEARRAIQGRLASLLRPGGFLVLGPTDQLDGALALDMVWGDGAVIYERPMESDRLPPSR